MVAQNAHDWIWPDRGLKRCIDEHQDFLGNGGPADPERLPASHKKPY